MVEKATDSFYNIFQYHEVFSNAIANMLTALVNAEMTRNSDEEKKATSILLVLYLWSRAYNNNPCSSDEIENLRSYDYHELLSLVIPELKKSGIAPVQAAFGESYYSRVISRIEDIKDLMFFLEIKKKFKNSDLFRKKIKEFFELNQGAIDDGNL